MIIAEQKKKENVAEYLLYMYQVEDMIRANKLDLDSIEQTLISKFDVPYGVKRDMREWYKSLIVMMQDERKEQSGHLFILEELAGKMHDLHHEILKQGVDTAYKETFDKAKSNIEALRMRSGHGKENDIQVALNGLYGLLILRLKKTPITDDTLRAFDSIKEVIVELSSRYMEKTS
jgi:flagellin-specific chaperone FliS